MTGKFQLKGGNEPSSDISLNWSDMRSGFGYKLLDDILRDTKISIKKWREVK